MHVIFKENGHGEKGRQTERGFSQAKKYPIGPIDLSGWMAPLMSKQPQLVGIKKKTSKLKPEHIKEPEICFYL